MVWVLFTVFLLIYRCHISCKCKIVIYLSIYIYMSIFLKIFHKYCYPYLFIHLSLHKSIYLFSYLSRPASSASRCSQVREDFEHHQTVQTQLFETSRTFRGHGGNHTCTVGPIKLWNRKGTKLRLSFLL